MVMMVSMKNVLTVLAIILGVLGFASLSYGQPAEIDDAAFLEQAATYLNSIDTLQARFLQIDGRGAVAEGDLYIDRPGKMRLAYDPPTPILIVADGYYVIYVDLELAVPSYLDIEDTPAAFLLEPEWSFSDDNVEVRNIERLPGVVEVTAARADDITAGELTFVFSERTHTFSAAGTKTENVFYFGQCFFSSGRTHRFPAAVRTLNYIRNSRALKRTPSL